MTFFEQGISHVKGRLKMSPFLFINYQLVLYEKSLCSKNITHRSIYTYALLSLRLLQSFVVVMLLPLIDQLSINPGTRWGQMSLYSSSYLALRPVQLLAIVHSSRLHLISGMHYLREFATRRHWTLLRLLLKLFF